jgi:hypothetical protein
MSRLQVWDPPAVIAIIEVDPTPGVVPLFSDLGSAEKIVSSPSPPSIAPGVPPKTSSRQISLDGLFAS